MGTPFDRGSPNILSDIRPIAELVKVFPENMKKVNSFFRDVGAARKPAAAADEAGEEVEAPAVGGAGGEGSGK